MAELCLKVSRKYLLITLSIIFLVMSGASCSSEGYDIPHDLNPVWWNCRADVSLSHIEHVCDGPFDPQTGAQQCYDVEWPYSTWELPPPQFQICGNESLTEAQQNDVKAVCERVIGNWVFGNGDEYSLLYSVDETGEVNVLLFAGVPLVSFFCSVTNLCGNGVPEYADIESYPATATVTPCDYAVNETGSSDKMSGIVSEEILPYLVDFKNSSSISLRIPGVGTESDNTTSGSAGYAWSCNEGDCKIAIFNFNFSMGTLAFSVDDETITLSEITALQNEPWVGDYNIETGEVTFAEGTVQVISEFYANGPENNGNGNIIFSNDDEVVTGQINPETGVFILSADKLVSRAKANGDPYELSFEIEADFVRTPPVAVINAPEMPVECTGDYLAEVQLSGADSLVGLPSTGSIEHKWYAIIDEGDETILGRLSTDISPTVDFGIGTSRIAQKVFNTFGVISVDKTDIVVVDTTPPEIDSSSISYEICTPNAALVEIETPLITDICTNDTTITVEGFLKYIDGIPAGMTPIVDGQLVLSEGTHVVEWVATDEFDNQSIAEQTIHVEMVIGPQCCDEDQTLWEGTSKKDKFFDVGNHYPNPKPAWCVLAYENKDKVRLHSGGGSYVALGEGRDSAILWDWQDYGMSTVVGEDGDDRIFIKHHNAQVYGGDGDDTIHLWDGENLVYGGYGDDIIEEGIGNDVIIPGPGRDYVFASEGDDTVYVYSLCELEAWEILDGGEGNDTLYLPISQIEAEAMGVQIYGFENILMTDATQEGLSDCV